LKRIHFNEVVTRDGFQMEPSSLRPEAKIALIDALSGSAREDRGPSFTSAKAIPICATPKK